MPLSRVYYTAANRPWDDVTSVVMTNASQFFGFAGLLTGTLTGENGPEGAPPTPSRWSVHSSSDGHAVVGVGDNINFTTFTPANWVAANTGTPHTWFVLQSPVTVLDGPWYLIVDIIQSNGFTYSIAKTPPSSGTLTQAAYSAIQSNSSIFGVSVSVEGSLTPGKSHLVVDADGNFWFWGSRNGKGFPSFLLLGASLAEARTTGDVARFVVWSNVNGSWPGPASSLMGDSSAAPIGLSPNGLVAMAGNSRMLTMYLSGSGVSSYFNSTSPIDGKLDAFPHPSWVFYGAAIRGRIPDMWNIGASVPVGSVEPSTGVQKRANMGLGLFPFSVVPSF